MNLSPSILIHTKRGKGEVVPPPPSNRERIREWQLIQPVQLGNGIAWKWIRPQKRRAE